MNKIQLLGHFSLTPPPPLQKQVFLFISFWIAVTNNKEAFFASNMFGAFSDFLATATQKAKELSDAGLEIVQSAGLVPELDKGYNVEEDEVDAAAALHEAGQATSANDEGSRPSNSTSDISVSANEIDLMVPRDILSYIPPQLQSFSGEWSVFLQGALLDENSYCVSLRTFLDHNRDGVETVERIASPALCRDVIEKIVKRSEECADVSISPQSMKAILESFGGAVNTIRFQVVPKFVSEDRFWRNLVTKCNIFYRCSSIPILLDVLEAVNREPRITADESRRKGFGTVCNIASLQKVRDDVAAFGIVSQWLESKRTAARSELQSALGSLQLLQNLTSKREVSELSDSVRESCKYRKTKIASILGELQGSTSKLKGTDLDPDDGELYGDLVRLNTQLHDAIGEYTTVKERLERGEFSESTPPPPGGCSGMPPHSPSSTVVLHDVSEGQTPVFGSPTDYSRRRDGNNAEIDDTEFTADLPWEDEDD